MKKNSKTNKKTPSLRALQKAGRSNLMVNFNFLFKQLKILSGLLHFARMTTFFLMCHHRQL